MFQRIAFFAVTVAAFVGSTPVAFAGSFESARIENSDGSCVRQKTNKVAAANCTSGLKQQWIHTEQGLLKSVDALVVDQQNRCIVGQPTGDFRMADCDASNPNQQFIRMDVDGVVELFNLGNTTSLDLELDADTSDGSGAPEWSLDTGNVVI